MSLKSSKSIFVILATLLTLYVVINYCSLDQPVRYAAVLIFAPFIFWKGWQYDDIYLMSFAVGLFVWDLYCILFKNLLKMKSDTELRIQR